MTSLYTQCPRLSIRRNSRKAGWKTSGSPPRSSFLLFWRKFTVITNNSIAVNPGTPKNPVAAAVTGLMPTHSGYSPTVRRQNSPQQSAPQPHRHPENGSIDTDVLDAGVICLQIHRLSYPLLGAQQGSRTVHSIGNCNPCRSAF